MNVHQATTSGKRVSGATPNKSPEVENSCWVIARGSNTHSAFAWGILDQLLEEPRLDFRHVVATKPWLRIDT
jgi:hypothetical protein